MCGHDSIRSFSYYEFLDGLDYAHPIQNFQGSLAFNVRLSSIAWLTRLHISHFASQLHLRSSSSSNIYCRQQILAKISILL